CNFAQPWWHPDNYALVGTPVKLFFCPSNRTSGFIDLGPIALQWGITLPPQAAACDYAFCRGANGAIPRDWTRIPLAVRAVFHIRQPDRGAGLRLTDISDGTSHTFAIGDAAGSSFYTIRDLNNPGQSATNTLTGQPAYLEQSWSAPGVEGVSHPWYGSVLAVAAQDGVAPDPRGEPVDRRAGTPTGGGGGPVGGHRRGRGPNSGIPRPAPRRPPTPC